MIAEIQVLPRPSGTDAPNCPVLAWKLPLAAWLATSMYWANTFTTAKSYDRPSCAVFWFVSPVTPGNCEPKSPGVALKLTY